MPERLPVTRDASPWLRYGAFVPILGLATLATALLAPVAGRTPFMFFYAAAVFSAFVGGVAQAALSVVLALAIIQFGIVPWAGSPPVGAIPSAGFVAVCAGMIWLTDRVVRSARTERALRAWSEVTLQSIGDAVIVTDAGGRVLTMNAVAEELTGWSRAEALEQPIAKVFEIVNERTRAAVENPIDRVCREGKVVGLANHTVLLSRAGREIPIDDSGAPIWNDEGRVVGAVLVFRDITERYEAEKQRTALLESERAAREEAQAANRAKDEFLAVLSHELRTPLHSILGWAQIGRTHVTSSEGLRSLEIIERNARRQAQLIEDMLDVSRIISGKLSLESAPVDLGDVVEAAIETVRPMVDAKGLALEVRGDCGGFVLGDASRLQQIVWNLLSNAVKFTPAGGCVQVVMERQGPVCAITVKDNGAGIALDFLPRVFERFRQEEGGTTRRYGGLGLGLTIVRHLAEMHGGSVAATSEGPGRGASFTVRIPLASERLPGADSRERPHDSEMADLTCVRVLAVDDEPDAREFLREVLERAGASVRVARSVEEALQALGQGPADVLLADVEMPGEDGYALLRRVREGGYGLPAIAITAHSSAEDRVRALTAGFEQHVPKPVTARELQFVVARTASRRRRAT